MPKPGVTEASTKSIQIQIWEILKKLCLMKNIQFHQVWFCVGIYL